MKLRITLTVLMALCFAACIILAIEGIFSAAAMLAGFTFFAALIFLLVNAPHPFTIFCSALSFVLAVYICLRFSWYEAVPGIILGVVVSSCLTVGWIRPHKLFSRHGYENNLSQGNEQTEAIKEKSNE